jgi:hypothetical protein
VIRAHMFAMRELRGGLLQIVSQIFRFFQLMLNIYFHTEKWVAQVI